MRHHVTECETKAVAQMRAASKALETAVNDALQGDYKGALEVAQGARDRLYHADVELRRARVASLQRRRGAA